MMPAGTDVQNRESLSETYHVVMHGCLQSFQLVQTKEHDVFGVESHVDKHIAPPTGRNIKTPLDLVILN